MSGDELVPDLTTELAEAATAQHRAEHEAALPARRFAVYDTTLERYVTGVVTRDQADEHRVSKSGRFRLHELDTEGRLERAALP